MYIEDAIKRMREAGTRCFRDGWDRIKWVAYVDPRIYPKVEGDLDEYSVMMRLVPEKEDGPNITVQRPFETTALAQTYIDNYRDTVHKHWERYEKYQKLLALKAATPLDAVDKPKYSREQVDSMWISASCKMGTKRLGMPYFAAMRKDACLEVYTFTPEDFHASDWRV